MSAVSRRIALPPLVWFVVVGCGIVSSGGCGLLRYRLDARAPETFLPNPVQVPAVRDQFLWNAITDTVDDFFQIAKQQPVVNSGNMVVDGRLETAYQVGGSIFEPWRKDSTAGFERLQSTLQSIRRRAIVTARPAIAAGSSLPMSPGGSVANADGYLIEVVVTKDLEDVLDPDSVSQVPEVSRHDGTLIRIGDRIDDSPLTLGWIPLGRDPQLEQRILSQILGRIQAATRHK
ncbi:MAG: hypothetical protein AAF958_12460 [Planctomycetota bacterium]